MVKKQIKAVSFEVENYKALAADINKFGKDGRKVMRYTMADMKKSAPGIIQNYIMQTYNIQKKDFKNKSIVSQRVETKKSNDALNVGVVYAGRSLTARHFDISPKKPPALKRLAKKDRYQFMTPQGRAVTVTKKRPPYEISYEVMKGKRVTLHPKGDIRYFLQKGRNGTQFLPWQVEGKGKPEVIHRLSVPQMLGNKSVNKGFMRELDKRLTERFKHHYNRVIEK